MTQTITDPTTLPELSSDYPLTGEQVRDYQRDGHIILRGVVSPAELAAYRPAINSAADRFNTETRALEERDTYGKAFLQIQNLWARDEAVRNFGLARRFAKLAADLMGVDGVRMYHDQALFKEPGGGPTPWHQDQSYWPLDTTNTITMWMPLVPLRPEIGSMTFANGTNSTGELRPFNADNPISAEGQAALEAIVKDRNLQTVHYGAMAAGDATFHSGWTLHSAPGNPTDTMREVMTIIYYADGVNVSQFAHKFHAEDRDKWMPGAQPGAPAVSDLNPLVYSRKS